jgi:hypothetical protein
MYIQSIFVDKRPNTEGVILILKKEQLTPKKGQLIIYCLLIIKMNATLSWEIYSQPLLLSENKFIDHL